MIESDSQGPESQKDIDLASDRNLCIDQSLTKAKEEQQPLKKSEIFRKEMFSDAFEYT